VDGAVFVRNIVCEAREVESCCRKCSRKNCIVLYWLSMRYDRAAIGEGISMSSGSILYCENLDPLHYIFLSPSGIILFDTY
jgi:hypothetical protein